MSEGIYNLPREMANKVLKEMKTQPSNIQAKFKQTNGIKLKPQGQMKFQGYNKTTLGIKSGIRSSE
jgi:hypothetical protein